MNHHYGCIRSRIGVEPTWFDEHGVPRYERFTPRDVADIYANEATLVRIQCQACHRPFDVAVSRKLWDLRWLRLMGERISALEEASRALHQAGESTRLVDDLLKQARETRPTSLADELRGPVGDRRLWCGDPPNVECCPAGPTMNADEIAVLEFWHQPQSGPRRFEWVRVPELRVDLADHAERT